MGYLRRDTKLAMLHMAHKTHKKRVAHYFDCHTWTVTRTIDTYRATGNVVQPARLCGRPRALNAIQVAVRESCTTFGVCIECRVSTLKPVLSSSPTLPLQS
jgi:transposase